MGSSRSGLLWERAKLGKEFSIPAAWQERLSPPWVCSRGRCLAGARMRLWGGKMPDKKVRLQIPKGFLNIQG